MVQQFDDIQKMEMKEKDALVSKCPSCGANTIFDPVTQKMKCKYCESEIDFEKAIANQETSIQNLLKQSIPWDKDTSVFRCDNCGAVEVVSNTEIAKDCPYCRSTSVIKTDEIAGLKPYGVIPFELDKQQAQQFAVNCVKKRFYVPKKFKKNFVADNLRGVYNPAFTFDSQTFSTYVGRLGRYETRTRVVSDGRGGHRTETYTVTIWFNVSGNYSAFFDDILIQASSTIGQLTIDKLAPFDTHTAKKYDANFLFGFSANQYNRDGMSCWNEAKKIIDKNIYRGILSRYTYDVVGSFNIQTCCDNITYKYLLLPIYIGATKFKQKVYNYFINGVNGKFTGNTPKSVPKILATIFVPIIVIGGGILLYWLLTK